MRLQKYLAQAGAASRRRAEELIIAGRVRVNGQVVTELGTKVEPDDQVSLDGRVLTLGQETVYVMLHKPQGVLSTVRDTHQRSKVLDLLGPELSRYRLYPVGRLDYDTEGLLILTNDGDFTYLLTHPKFHVPKTYLALIRGLVSDTQLRQLELGLPLEDGMTAPAEARVIKQSEKTSLIELVLTEGRKRQVKRMCAYIGHPVLKLVRTGFGKLTLSGLAVGKYRFLSKEEVDSLLKMAKEGE